MKLIGLRMTFKISGSACVVFNSSWHEWYDSYCVVRHLLVPKPKPKQKTKKHTNKKTIAFKNYILEFALLFRFRVITQFFFLHYIFLSPGGDYLKGGNNMLKNILWNSSFHMGNANKRYRKPNKQPCHVNLRTCFWQKFPRGNICCYQRVSLHALRYLLARKVISFSVTHNAVLGIGWTL